MHDNRFNSKSMRKALGLLVAVVLGVLPARAATVQTLFTLPSIEPYGVAVDLADQLVFYTGDSFDGIVALYGEDSKQNGLLSQSFQAPAGILLARNGVILADSLTQQILWLNPVCDTNTVLAGSGIQGKADGQGTNAQFANPTALAMDSAGNIYIADWNGLRKMDTANNVTTLATGFNKPAGVAVGLPGELWVADTLNHVIKKVTVTDKGATVQIVAGKKGISGFSDNVTGLNATFNQPRGLWWVGGQTGLIVADSGNGALRSVSYDSSCGCYSVGTIGDGMGSPTGVTVDNEGAILVTDPKKSSLEEVIRDGQGAPALYPPPGSYSNAVTVSFYTATLAMFSPTFHYTLDGSKPLFTSTAGNYVTLDGGGIDYSDTVNVRTFSPDLMTSPLTSGKYSFFVSMPTMEPPGTTNNNSVMVTLHTDTAGADLYWTIDGSEPAPGSANHYVGPFLLTQTGDLKVKGFRSGYAPSAVSVSRFTLYVSDPAIIPDSVTNNNDFTVSMFTETAGASIYYTTDGSFPDVTSTPYTKPFTLSKSCTMRAKAYRDGFLSSGTVTRNYGFVVSDPFIRPNGATNDNPVQVVISTATAGASLFWTLDGTEPTQASTPAINNVPFTLAKSGTLIVKAFKDGYTPSTNVSAVFNFYVDPPQVVPGSVKSVDSIDVSMGVPTAGAVLHYTTDGTTPTAGSPVYSGPLTLTNSTTLAVIAMRDGFVSSAPIVNTYQIQVDAPVMNPAGGYFPDGGTVSFAVQRPDAVIYYTSNGQDPTPSDNLYTGPFRVDQVLFPGDLRVIKARAFAPGTLPSDVVTGRNVDTNSLGVPRDMVGGIGASLVVPVVANVVSNRQIRSLQFRLEVVPASPGAPAMTDDLVALSVSTNDFVPAISQSTDGNPVTNWFQAYSDGFTNGVYFYSVAGNLLVKDFALISNFKVKIPNTALEGDSYKISILELSATSDAGQLITAINPLPARTLTVSNLSYMAGDTAVGGWYNAGDFGDRNLDNADVNTAIDASLGIHVPYPFSDAFKAMDVYPEGAGIIGDGMISYLDWHHVLLRSLGRETNNWIRFWTPGGVLGHKAVGAPGSSLRLRAAPESLLSGDPSATGTNISGSTSNALWLRHAVIVAQTMTNLMPGSMCSMPVYIKVLPGYSVAGLQFRAVCTAEAGAPAPGSVVFVSAGGMPAPMAHALASPNEAACVWTMDSLPKPLQGSNLLGTINFQIPSDAKPGQRYDVQLLAPDGAADGQTALAFESVTGMAWVQSGPAVMPRVVSDQWKTNFFGSIDSKDADGEADPDHDGIPNWQEYLAGTNPTNALSRLGFSRADVQGNRISLRWEGAPGRVYIVERSSALHGAPWTPVLTNTSAQVDSSTVEATYLNGDQQFYRIRLLQP